VAATASAVLLVLAAAPALSHQRELASTLQLQHQAVQTIVGAGVYNPRSSPTNGALQVTAGLRYMKPEPGESTHFGHGFEASLNLLSTDFEDIFTLQAGVLQFLNRSDLFTFDHNFFFGSGLGTAFVNRRRNRTDLTLPEVYFVTGLQSRITDWYLEGSARYIIAPRRKIYDATGVMTQVVVTRYLDL
jgi:hypothetical protein